MEELQPIKVMIKVNKDDEIIAINSEIFIENTEGWIIVDEGNGDKFAHAQSQYLDKPLIDDNGKYNYKLRGSNIVEVKKK